MFFFVPKEMLNGKEYKTTFHMDFDIADHFGLGAVIDTFKRAFREWKNDIEYATELAIVMNIRSWFWYEHGNKKLSEEYAKRWYEVRSYIYSDKAPFTDEDRQYFYEMTD